MSWLRGAGDGTLGPRTRSGPPSRSRSWSATSPATAASTWSASPTSTPTSTSSASWPTAPSPPPTTTAWPPAAWPSATSPATACSTWSRRWLATAPAVGSLRPAPAGRPQPRPGRRLRLLRHPGPVEIGDLNGDGRLDVVTLHDGYLDAGRACSLQDTDGTLTADRRFPIPYGHYAKKALDVGDVTGDGRPDVVWAERPASLVLRALAPLPRRRPPPRRRPRPPSTTSTIHHLDDATTTTSRPRPPPATSPPPTRSTPPTSGRSGGRQPATAAREAVDPRPGRHRVVPPRGRGQGVRPGRDRPRPPGAPPSSPSTRRPATTCGARSTWAATPGSPTATGRCSWSTTTASGARSTPPPASSAGSCGTSAALDSPPVYQAGVLWYHGGGGRRPPNLRGRRPPDRPAPPR